jgi:prepilin-type processing-associated H-X9-DG protein
LPGVTPVVNPGGEGWASAIWPYTKSAGVYKCPDDLCGSGTGSGSGGPDVVSYAINPNYTTNGSSKDAGVTPGAAEIGDSGFSAPANTILLTEVQNDAGPGDSGGAGSNAVLTDPYDKDSSVTNGLIPTGNNGIAPQLVTGAMGGMTQTLYQTAYVGDPDGRSPADVFNGLLPRHTNGSNFLMADGHVKFLEGAAVSIGYNAPNGPPIDANTNVTTPAFTGKLYGSTFTQGNAASATFNSQSAMTSGTFAATYSVY